MSQTDGSITIAAETGTDANLGVVMSPVKVWMTVQSQSFLVKMQQLLIKVLLLSHQTTLQFQSGAVSMTAIDGGTF